MSAASPDLLVIDDDPGAGILAKAVLRGRRIHVARSKGDGLTQFGQHRPRLILLDVGLPDGDGLALIDVFLGIDPFAQIIVITGNAETDVVVRAMRAGAVDFLQKPFVPEQLLGKIARAERGLPSTPVALRLAGESQQMVRITDRLLRVAVSDVTTLILGETGTGKELAARAVHDLSPRAGKPFVAVNCAAISPSLLESELFGYERGAFTGAASDGKRGLFEAAAGGTVLLDEIGETSVAFQATLLRVLESRTLRRVGGVVERPIDVRVVASTNRDLAAEVREGRFRSDLYFRLSVVRVVLPPLAARVGDVRVLSLHFLRELERATGRQLELRPAALAALEAHPWPGNVRELRNVIERAAIFCAPPWIEVSDLELDPPDVLAAPPPARAATPPPAPAAAPDGRIVLDGPRLDEAEQVLIRHAMDLAGGHQGRAAKLLGINRTTLYKKLKRQGDATPAEEVADDDDDEALSPADVTAPG